MREELLMVINVGVGPRYLIVLFLLPSSVELHPLKFRSQNVYHLDFTIRIVSFIVMAFVIIDAHWSLTIMIHFVNS